VILSLAFQLHFNKKISLKGCCCLPRQYGNAFTQREHVSSSHSQLLFRRDPNMDVFVMPLYLDRVHPHREQLRACRLPIGYVVDSATVVHIVPRREVYFWLALFNSAVVEAILCHHEISPVTTWITLSGVKRLPIPHPLPIADIMCHTVNVSSDALMRHVTDRCGTMTPSPSFLRTICGDTVTLVRLIATLGRYLILSHACQKNVRRHAERHRKRTVVLHKNWLRSTM
jgi:hypothetical protein